MVPGICRELAISEHEFFTACDDLQARKQQRQAKSWSNLVRGWQVFICSGYAIALAVCFLSNLIGAHRLDWFWIVLASLALAFCFTSLPAFVQRQRIVVCLLAASACLLLLLVSCGVWSAALIVAVCLLLPWAVYAAWRHSAQHAAVLGMAAFTGWLYLLVGMVRATGGGSWYWPVGVPVVTFCCMFLWAYFSICRWARVNRWFKAAACTAVTAVILPVTSLFISAISPGSGGGYPSFPLFFDWSQGLFYETPDGSVHGERALFTFLLLLAAGLLCIGFGVLLRKRRHAPPTIGHEDQ